MEADDSKVIRQRLPSGRAVLLDTRLYALQILGVTLFLGAALLTIQELAHLPVVTSIASSAFLVLCIPAATMSRPRNVLGGYLWAITAACLASLFTESMDSGAAEDAIAAIAVGLSLVLMTLTRTEHVPAAGTTLALSLGSWDWGVAASTLLLAAALVVLHGLCRGRLVNMI